MRASKTISGTAPINYTWELNAGLPVIVQDSNYSYVYGLGGLISQTDGLGNQTYFLANGLGSTEKLTDGLGNVTASYKYDVFGAVRSSSGTGWSEYRFTGQEDDAALGMTYLRVRYYDMGTGRFITNDPVAGWITQPSTQQPYTYVNANPTNLVDPTGQCPWCGMVTQVFQRLGPPVTRLGQRATGLAQRVIDACRGLPTSRGISITGERLAHVLNGHTAGGIDSGGRASFILLRMSLG